MQIHGEYIEIAPSYYPEHEKIPGVLGAQFEISNRELRGDW